MNIRDISTESLLNVYGNNNIRILNICFMFMAIFDFAGLSVILEVNLYFVILYTLTVMS